MKLFCNTGKDSFTFLVTCSQNSSLNTFFYCPSVGTTQKRMKWKTKIFCSTCLNLANYPELLKRPSSTSNRLVVSFSARPDTVKWILFKMNIFVTKRTYMYISGRDIALRKDTSRSIILHTRTFFYSSLFGKIVLSFVYFFWCLCSPSGWTLVDNSTSKNAIFFLLFSSNIIDSTLKRQLCIIITMKTKSCALK